MTNNFLKFTVIFLAILILVCFVFLLYGLYSKISNTEGVKGLTNEEITSYSLKLSNAETIKDIKIINENNLLFVISDNDQIYLIIYNLDNKQIISKIGR